MSNEEDGDRDVCLILVLNRLDGMKSIECFIDCGRNGSHLAYQYDKRSLLWTVHVGHLTRNCKVVSAMARHIALPGSHQGLRKTNARIGAGDQLLSTLACTTACECHAAFIWVESRMPSFSPLRCMLSESQFNPDRPLRIELDGDWHLSFLPSRPSSTTSSTMA